MGCGLGSKDFPECVGTVGEADELEKMAAMQDMVPKGCVGRERGLICPHSVSQVGPSASRAALSPPPGGGGGAPHTCVITSPGDAPTEARDIRDGGLAYVGHACHGDLIVQRFQILSSNSSSGSQFKFQILTSK
jgi:hypothetical protein